MDFRITIATGEFPHQPNNTVNCSRKIRYCGVTWLVSRLITPQPQKESAALVEMPGFKDSHLMSVSNGSHRAVTTVNIDYDGTVRFLQGNTGECAGRVEGLLSTRPVRISTG